MVFIRCEININLDKYLLRFNKNLISTCLEKLDKNINTR